MGNGSSYPASLPYAYLEEKSNPSSLPTALLGNTFLQLDEHHLIVFGGGEKDAADEQSSSGDQTKQKHASINKVHVFDTQNQTWKHYDINGDAAPINRGNFVAAVSEGESTSETINVVLFGGSNEFHGWLDDVHLLVVKIDSKSNELTFEWKTVTTTGNTPSPRDKASSFIYQKKLFVFGGFGPVDASGKSNISLAPTNNEKAGSDDDEEDDEGDMAEFTWFNDMHCLDLTTFKWSKVNSEGTAPSPRAATSIAFFGGSATGYLYGGRDVVARQNDLKKFILSSDSFGELKATWSVVLLLTPTIPTGRSFHTLLPISDTQLLLVGGMNTEDNPKNDIMVFDIEIGSWFTLPNEVHEKTFQDLQNFKNGGTNATAPPTASVIKPLGTDKAIYDTKNKVVFVFGEYLDNVILALNVQPIITADRSSLQLKK